MNRVDAVDRHADIGSMTLAAAQGIWCRHRADRAWVEWGICWPPLSIARPRCACCQVAWPCGPVLDAYARLSAQGVSGSRT